METETINKNLSVYQFLETQLEVFKGYFIVTRAIQDEEAIHQMRVAIKRIRSIRKLKKHINFPSLLNEEQYNNIKSLFAISGQMRDLHVQQKLLKKFNKVLELEFVDFATYLVELQAQQHHLLHESLQSFNLKQIEGLGNNPGLADFPEGSIDIERESFGFLHQKLEKINHLIQLMNQDEFVHNLRKQVKHLFFILYFFSTHFPERKIGSYNVKALKEVSEKLGAWNDREIFKHRLESFMDSMEESYLNIHPEYTRLMERLEEEKQNNLQGVDAELGQELEKIMLLIDGKMKQIASLRSQKPVH